MGAKNGSHEKIIATVRAGRTTPEALCEATGLDRINLSSTLGYMRRQGRIEYAKISPTQIDWPTLRVIGEAPKPSKTREQAKPREPKAPKAAEVSDDLEHAISVTFSREEVIRLSVLARELTALVATLESSPPIGKDGAHLVRILARVQGK